jgi:hypothetical protein
MAVNRRPLLPCGGCCCWAKFATGVTFHTKFLDAEALSLPSVAVIVTSNGPLALFAIVPVMAPVELLMLSPVGSPVAL